MNTFTDVGRRLGNERTSYDEVTAAALMKSLGAETSLVDDVTIDGILAVHYNIIFLSFVLFPLVINDTLKTSYIAKFQFQYQVIQFRQPIFV